MSTLPFTPSAQACVLVLGLGATGVAAARWIVRSGRRCRIADTRDEPSGQVALQRAFASVTPPVMIDYHLGCRAFDLSLLDDVVQVVISPGLAPTQAPAAALLAEAAARGVEVVSEIELFARALADLAHARQYCPKLLVITGTNGKTTVTALTRLLVLASGQSVQAVGNLGPAALLTLMAAIDNDRLPAVWVLEISSFQLITTTTLVPDAAVVLNVSQDHLDWHGDMHAYVQAKARLLHMARIAIVNRDDPFTVGMAQGIEDKRVHSFGQDEPTWVGDFGIVHEQELAWLATCDAHDGKVVARPLRDRGHMTRLLSLNKLRLRGRHNVMNVLAGLALGRAIDLPWDAMLHAIQDYAGEAHRLEFVYRIGRVDFFNDSKGTNVGATVAALEGLGQMAVLIVGGVGKGQNFSLLCPAVTRHARAVLFIGQDGPQIAQALTPSGVPCLPALDLAVAVRQAMKLAHPGDAVLLSPACASTDMFQHYAHRGQSFVQAVQALVLEKGAHA